MRKPNAMPQSTPPGRLRALASRISAWLATTPATAQKTAQARSYSAARKTRTTGGFGSAGNSSADSELSRDLPTLRARSRQMVRDSSYAKRARTIIENNVIGTGVNLQCQVATGSGSPRTRVNADIEAVFSSWCAADSCHTGGALHFHDLERMALGEVFEAGEILIRKHYGRFGSSAVPLALEVIEPERLAENLVDPGAFNLQGELRQGFEVDEFGRELAAWIRKRHPGDPGHSGAVDRFERVPASDYFHLRIINRWPQTRGEPWMHTSVRKLDDMHEFTGLELTAARGSASYFATIESPEVDPLTTGRDIDTEQAVVDLEPLTVQQLDPGEKLTFHSPTRPNAALDPFMRAMLREVAAGVGVSYESLSRDYSQSNYSSSRLALLDDRDLFRTVQQWWIRSFRQPLHQAFVQQAVLAGALASVPVAEYAAAPAKFSAARFKPRGWTWIDPTREVAAYKEAIKANLTSASDVISQTGGGLDIEDVLAARAHELQLMDELGLAADTTVQTPAQQAAAAAAQQAAAAAAQQQAASTPPGRAAEGAQVHHLKAKP